jgi:hypothetical protein
MFTRGGFATIVWAVRDASGTRIDRKITYRVSSSSRSRPYRLFWTKTDNISPDQKGFDGPPVSFAVQGSASLYKQVRLYGDTNLLTCLDADGNPVTDSRTNNIAWGVRVDESSHTLYAYATPGESVHDEHRGPTGQFILAYYDTSLKNLLCTIVVEVCEPSCTVLNAEVGQRLQPTGQGYSTNYIDANIVAGNQDVDGDPNAPYLYKHAGKTDFSPKSRWVYALAPNDAEHQEQQEPEYKRDCPEKAAIYWQSTDPMGTVWPFEYDQYLIKWGTNLPKVVTGGTENPGCGILLPSKFDGTTEVEHYSSPALIASVGGTSSNRISYTGAGFFLLKLIADDNIWYLPFQSVSNTDKTLFDRTSAEWYVGMEIEPRADEAAGTGALQAAAVDPELPGYVYEPGSTGKNWNPHLYRLPHLPTAAEETLGDSGSDDPWDALESAIYAVRADKDPIEVWWFAERREDDMPAALRYPTSVQCYKAIWPRPEETHTIVLASQLGSAGDSLAATDRALYLAATNSSATVVSGITPGKASAGATFGFWINPSPRAAGCEPVGEGTVLLAGNASGTIAMEMINGGTNLSVFCFTTNNIWGYSLDTPTNDWSHVAITVSTDGTTRVFLDDKAAEMQRPLFTNLPAAFPASFATNKTTLGIGANDTNWASATGVALDHLAVWPFVLPDEQIALVAAGGTDAKVERLRYSWSFDRPGDLEHIPGLDTRTAFDTASGRALRTRNCLGPGGPSAANGLLETLDGVEPRVYAQNDPGAVG